MKHNHNVYTSIRIDDQGDLSLACTSPDGSVRCMYKGICGSFLVETLSADNSGRAIYLNVGSNVPLGWMQNLIYDEVLAASARRLAIDIFKRGIGGQALDTAITRLRDYCGERLFPLHQYAQWAERDIYVTAAQDEPQWDLVEHGGAQRNDERLEEIDFTKAGLVFRASRFEDEEGVENYEVRCIGATNERAVKMSGLAVNRFAQPGELSDADIGSLASYRLTLPYKAIFNSLEFAVQKQMSETETSSFGLGQ